MSEMKKGYWLRGENITPMEYVHETPQFVTVVHYSTTGNPLPRRESKVDCSGRRFFHTRRDALEYLVMDLTDKKREATRKLEVYESEIARYSRELENCND